ncbi:MAG: DNA polymerase IV [Nitrososphaerota archaeon]|nr:DNA polymerase IV [Nitrososphaerota archaeon]
MNDRIVIAVDLDYFFAQCEEVRRPEIQRKPVVICVYSGRTGDSGAVSTANYVARKKGVKSGVPISVARKLLEDSKDAIFLPVDQEYYKAISERIMELLRSFSYNFEQVSIDEAFLDLSSVAHNDYNVALEIASKIKSQIMEAERLTCSVGISKNKLLAKMAADSQKPDGLTVLRPESIADTINPLPVGKLPGVGTKTEKRMEELGIHTIGDLALFNREILAAEFGRNLGPHLASLACGIDNEPVQERERQQLGRIITLKHDTSDFSFAEEIRPLIADISKRLRSSNSRCKMIGIIVITSALKTKSRAKTLDQPTDSEEVIIAVSSELFKSYFESDQEGIPARRVGIRVSELVDTGHVKSGQSLSDYF